MKLVFLSNYFNHHQRYLSDALATRCDYTFLATTPYNEKRLALGWTPEEEPAYVCHYEADPQKAVRLLEEADVVLTGSAPEKLVQHCIQKNKLVLRYSERPLKKGLELKKFLPRFVKWHCQNPPWRKVYMLCASGYTASDYRKFGLFRGKTFRWGYFPKMKAYESGETLLSGKKPGTILWAGRFLDWKHPDDALAVAESLKKRGISFRMKIIGSGEMEDILGQRVQTLSDCVELTGAVPPEQVRECMEEAEIFLFTSDRKEGWGVVLNEAMNSGCAVVANRDIGSAPFLIKDGENGLLYPSGDVETLCNQVETLLSDPALTKKLGSRAYETILESWNPEVAAERLLCLAQSLQEGKRPPYTQGPCSPT